MDDQNGNLSEDVIAKFLVLQELLDSPASKKVLNDVKNKDIVVFIGTTKSGKSTLVNYAIGNKLVAILNDDDEYLIMKEGGNTDGPKIGEISVSETTSPTMWKTKRSGLKEYIVDMPGFDDNRGEAQDIANAFYISEIIRNCKSVKCVLLADMHGLIHTDISIFTNLIEKIYNIFPDIKVLKGGIALIISKVDKKITQDRICKKLTNDILLQDKLDIDGREWVKYFVDNKKCIAFFKVPTSDGVINDDDVDCGILDTIQSQLNQIPVENLANVKPGIARKSKIFLLSSHALFSDMSYYNSMLKRLEDWIVSECGRIHDLNDMKDVLEMEETLLNLRNKVAELAIRVKTLVTLSDVLDFVKEISYTFGIEMNADQYNIDIKVKFLEFIETIVKVNSSSIFIRELQRTIKEMLNEINLASLIASNKLKKITLEEMEQQKKELDEKHKEENERLDAEIKLLQTGVTCGGKSTLANSLVATLVPDCTTTIISLDDYFLPKQDQRHVWIPELKLINWESIQSIDRERLMKDINEIVSREGDNQVLLIDGHTGLNIPEVAALCHLKYFFTLSENECFVRRVAKPYNKPDKPGYFKQAVWPSYQEHMREVEHKYQDVRMLSGMAGREELVDRVRGDILESMRMKTRPASSTDTVVVSGTYERGRAQVSGCQDVVGDGRSSSTGSGDDILELMRMKTRPASSTDTVVVSGCQDVVGDGWTGGARRQGEKGYPGVDEDEDTPGSTDTVVLDHKE